MPAPARERELERLLSGGEHDEPAIRAGHLNRRVQHEDEHVLHDVGRAKRAKPLEQGGGLTNETDERLAGSELLRLIQEHHLDDRTSAQADAVAVY